MTPLIINNISTMKDSSPLVIHQAESPYQGHVKTWRGEAAPMTYDDGQTDRQEIAIQLRPNYTKSEMDFVVLIFQQ